MCRRLIVQVEEAEAGVTVGCQLQLKHRFKYQDLYCSHFRTRLDIVDDK